MSSSALPCSRMICSRSFSRSALDSIRRAFPIALAHQVAFEFVGAIHAETQVIHSSPQIARGTLTIIPALCFWIHFIHHVTLAFEATGAKLRADHNRSSGSNRRLSSR